MHRQRPMRKATREALEGIGKVFQHEKAHKSKLDIELGLDSEEDSKELDLFIPPTNKDSRSTSLTSSPLTATEEKSTSPINLPTLPPINERDLHMERNLHNADVNTSNRKKRNKASMFDSFIESSSVSITSNTTDSKKDLISNDIVPNGTTNTTKGQRKESSSANNTNIKKKGTKKATVITRCKIKNISDVYASFELPKSTRSCIPTITDLRNEEALNRKHANKWRGLINMSKKCIDQTLEAICPGPSYLTLKSDVIKDFQDKEEAIISSFKSKTDFEKINNKILHVLFTMLKNSKNASIEKRVLRAVIAKTLKRGMIKSKCDRYGLMDITSGSIVHKINEDFKSLMNGIPIEKKVQTRCKVSDDIIQEAVGYILHKDHIITSK